jgi:hypothetical protein
MILEDFDKILADDLTLAFWLRYSLQCGKELILYIENL